MGNTHCGSTRNTNKYRTGHGPQTVNSKQSYLPREARQDFLYRSYPLHHPRRITWPGIESERDALPWTAVVLRRILLYKMCLSLPNAHEEKESGPTKMYSKFLRAISNHGLSFPCNNGSGEWIVTKDILVYSAQDSISTLDRALECRKTSLENQQAFQEQQP